MLSKPVSPGAMIVDNWDANYKILSLFLYLVSWFREIIEIKNRKYVLHSDLNNRILRSLIKNRDLIMGGNIKIYGHYRVFFIWKWK